MDITQTDTAAPYPELSPEQIFDALGALHGRAQGFVGKTIASIMVAPRFTDAAKPYVLAVQFTDGSGFRVVVYAGQVDMHVPTSWSLGLQTP